MLHIIKCVKMSDLSTNGICDVGGANMW